MGCGRCVSMAMMGTEEKDRCSNWKLGVNHPCLGIDNSKSGKIMFLGRAGKQKSRKGLVEMKN
eukprot:scaffold17925_cov56-Attheya_sp.AAC.5